MAWPPSTSRTDDEIPCTGRGDIDCAPHVDDANASSLARVAAELANTTTRMRPLSLARWVMKVNAPKEYSPNAADAEDLIQTALAPACDPEKKPWLAPKRQLCSHPTPTPRGREDKDTSNHHKDPSDKEDSIHDKWGRSAL